MPRRLLPAVLLVAFAIRVWGIQFGLPFAYARPDETEVAGPAVAYLSGDLRPHFFQWPSLFGYAVAALYALYGGAFGFLTGHASLADFAQSRYLAFAPFLLIPRTLSVAMGVATVGAVFALARRAFDETVAVVAALFLALAFLHVRDSHFGMSDVTMTALVVVAAWATLGWYQRGGLWRAGAAGLLVGLAGSTKYNGLLVGVSFAVAALLRLTAAPPAQHAGDRRPDEAPTGVTAVVTAVAVFAVATAAGFFGGSPFILVDWPRFVADIATVQSTMSTGHGGLRVGRGWWYFGLVVLPAGLGWPVFIAGVAGVVALPVTRVKLASVLLAFPLAYYAYAGQSYSVFARYILPVIPFLCVTAAWTTVTALRTALVRVSGRTSGLVMAGTAAALIAPSAWSAVQLDRLLAAPDNRVVAARALADILRAEDRLYQSGASYGRVPVGLNGVGAEPREVTFDADAGTFAPAEPTWILVQRSPLTIYSRVPDTLTAVLQARFTLVARFPVDAAPGTARVYDQQDAFYVPLSGLTGLRRPGPAFELYRRR